MRILMIHAESNDLCGISEDFVFHTELEDEDMALDSALEQFGDEMDEALLESYDVEVYDDPSFSFTAQWYTEETFGDLDCGAYIKLN